MSVVAGTTILELWAAFSNGLAIVGAIIADSYLGRFRAVVFGSISTLIVTEQIDDGFQEPAVGVVQTNAQQTELEALKLKDLKAKNYLFQAIDRSILETILCKDTSKHI
ncbi:hypothetical protein KY284_023214 [Solanum tuberosum]|nr:hypothetical protein KY284_023214 [Solanum tuberosum]